MITKGPCKILIVGSSGMVGKVIFKYLQSHFPNETFGTSRNKEELDENIFYLNVETCETDLKIIKKNIGQITYIINCIGVLRDYKSFKELILANALLPHTLETFAKDNSCFLIHISTDAVFSPFAGNVNESSEVSPVDFYGKSKLLGETTIEEAITIRTSFIDYEKDMNKGLLATAIKNNIVSGYTNQLWTGCTAVQFAQFCESIMKPHVFINLRKKSNIYHFVPIGPLSKFAILKSFTRIIKLEKRLKKTISEPVTRSLRTNYFDLLSMSKYTDDIDVALTEMLQFHNNVNAK